jgi:hypothetical protein
MSDRIDMRLSGGVDVSGVALGTPEAATITTDRLDFFEDPATQLRYMIVVGLVFKLCEGRL